jgi:hypothetical protein
MSLSSISVNEGISFSDFRSVNGFAIKMLFLNTRALKNLGDIIGSFDVVWASPPCTEYSRAKTTGIRKIEYANKKYPKLQTDLYTNAGLLDSKLSDELLEKKLHKMQFF